MFLERRRAMSGYRPGSTVALFRAVLFTAALFLVGGLAACSSQPQSDSATQTTATPESTEAGETSAGTDPEAVAASGKVSLITHDSFLVPDDMWDRFTVETGIEVEVIQRGDTGELVATALLTVGQPEADVLFGIDNTFLQRGLDAELFSPYQPQGTDDIRQDLLIDPEFRVTPVDYGYVCLNYWKSEVPSEPVSLDEMTDPAFASELVVIDPEASSPGFAFLLATIAAYGEDGWQQYWTELFAGGATVAANWTDAYYGEFVTGGGDGSIVVSYSGSPAYEALFGEAAGSEAPTAIVEDSCFEQIEFAGILNGAENEAAAQMLMDFLISETFQDGIPLTMFVNPANTNVELPELYSAHAQEVENPLRLSPEEIEANRSRWTDQWIQIARG